MPRLLCATIFSLLAFSCATVPQKPVVELCQLDSKMQWGRCGRTGEDKTRYFVSLDELDKATVIRPEEWKALQVYIHGLEDYLKINGP